MSELQIDPADITQAIRASLQGFEPEVEVSRVGRVVEVGDGIARVAGLPDAAVNELLQFDNGALGLALNLDEDTIGAVVLADSEQAAEIEEGSTVEATGQIQTVPVGDELIGRVVNSLGEPIDGSGDVNAGTTRRMEIQAPGITRRRPVHEPLQTGIKAIDSMTPIGRGQRELIIGDRKTGKTTIGIDTILNQKGEDVKCIYVAVGQKGSTVAQTVATLRRARRHGLHGRGRARPPRTPRPSSTSRRTRAAPWASTGWRTARRPSSSTTTCPSRPRPTARWRCCCAVPRGARRIPATSSTCTAACSSGQPS